MVPGRYLCPRISPMAVDHNTRMASGTTSELPSHLDVTPFIVTSNTCWCEGWDDACMAGGTARCRMVLMVTRAMESRAFLSSTTLSLVNRRKSGLPSLAICSRGRFTTSHQIPLPSAGGTSLKVPSKQGRRYAYLVFDKRSIQANRRLCMHRSTNASPPEDWKLRREWAKGSVGARIRLTEASGNAEYARNVPHCLLP